MSSKWSCTSCQLSENNNTSKCKRCASKQTVVSLMYYLKDNNEDVKGFMFNLMDHLDDDEKTNINGDQDKGNKNNISLLADSNMTGVVCHKGHPLFSRHKNYTNEACIQCNKVMFENYGNIKTKNNQKKLLAFVNKYNISSLNYGPDKQWLKQQSQIWQRDGDAKNWPLHYAAMIGDTKMISYLCENENRDVNKQMTVYSNKTPIVFAAWYNQLRSLIYLIKYGANPFPTPDKGNVTPYDVAVRHKCDTIIEFYNKLFKSIYNVSINKYIFNNHLHLECFHCFQNDNMYNQQVLDVTMGKYTYCQPCGKLNVKKVKSKMETNKVIERQMVKILQNNPNISLDTLCQMKDKKALVSLLKETTSSGYSHEYNLYLFHVDNLKSINTHLMHHVANTKLIRIANALKDMEQMTKQQWLALGIDIWKIHSFRQEDKFSMVVYGPYRPCNRMKTQQKLYELIRSKIDQIALENVPNISHVTLSVGVCLGKGAKDFEFMLKHADEAAEQVKQNGKNNIRVYEPWTDKMYTNFNELNY